MRELVDRYLEAHEGAWALTTYKSEASRLRAVSHLLHLTPEDFVADRAKILKPYALKTLMIRLCHFEKWVGGAQRYRDYMQKYKNKFKHAYVKEEINVGFESVQSILSGLSPKVRDTAIALLQSGLRISEFYQCETGSVVGKGGKTRKVFGNISQPRSSRAALRNALKTLGLKPHTLRKLCATRCAERGATPADLCKIFGWSDIRTAYAYLIPRDDARLAELMK